MSPARKANEMQAYSRSFARVYNMRWSDFSRHVAPRIQAYYESTSLGQENKRVLDLCCGTGQLAVHFLERGYDVTGLDLSDEMLHYARQNAAPYIERGSARFVQGDAADFDFPQRFGLAVSTFDALNHLPDKDSLSACFQCVHRVLVPDGTFVFDLNTRAGLRSGWNGIAVQDTEEATIINRGFYDPENEVAWVKISGYLCVDDGLYERFEQVAYNTAFDLAWVQAALLEDGWQTAHAARITDLVTPLADPEAEHRVFFVATR
jgi:SAM-dependent methyltransferase